MASLMSVDELVATLRKTSLPTAIVEGTSDQSIYRWIEQRAGVAAISVLPCGGRTSLLEVYRRREEFRQAKTVFVADRDMWFFTAVPADLDSIIWTSGYSIENDVYSRSAVEDLLSDDERSEFDEVRREIIRWFSFEVEEYRAGREACVANHPNEVVTLGSRMLSRSFCEKRGFRNPTSPTVAEVESQYKLAVRGKTLLLLLVRFLSRPGRESKYSYANVVEMALKMTRVNECLEKLLSSIQAAMS